MKDMFLSLRGRSGFIISARRSNRHLTPRGTVGILVVAMSALAAMPVAASPSWSVAPSPDPQVITTNILNGVSCVSTSSCTAVGSSGLDTLVETWNGTAWSTVPSPSTGGHINALNGVSCESASSCTAVGSYQDPANPNETLTLVEAWNGTSWSIVPCPNSGTNGSFLTGVSCVSASSCVAVGVYIDAANVDQTLIESWDGTAWSIIPSPNSGTNGSFLYGVSCLSVGSCTAAGSDVIQNGGGYVYQTLIESWDGTSWSIVPSPNRGTSATSNFLNALSCVSATSCTTVGSSSAPASVNQTLVESWNGTAWSIVPSPNNGGNELNSVSCLSTSSCMAVGDYPNINTKQTLIESWDGTAWSIVPSPNSGSGSNSLRGVSCVSATSCTAVGYFVSGDYKQTLVEIGDPTSWSIVPSPNDFGTYSFLNGVSCVSPTSCEAVGGYNPTFRYQQTLVESWNGIAWSIIASPNMGTHTSNSLGGVSCVTTRFCVAVGSYFTPAKVNRTLIESWDGTSWSIVPSPNHGTLATWNALDGVSCVSVRHCVAVGSSNKGARTLIESWNGTRWSVVPSPSPGTSLQNLRGVSCASVTSCTAVGSPTVTGNRRITLIESWNGTRWSVVPSPSPGTSDNVLSGVSCVSASSCKAVGFYVSSAAPQTLIESWDGTSWSLVPSPSPSATGSWLNAVSCVSASSCTAAGRASANLQRALIEQDG